MLSDKKFKLTDRQKEARNLLSGPAKHVMLYGGSRSGKTFLLVRSVIIRAAKEKSRHVILRAAFNHVKTSIWMDTLPKVISLCFPEIGAKLNKTDYVMTLPNGSEVWFAGLDDSDRVEKILGKEYSTIYFNECSQISYDSIQIALTRLAEKNSLKKKAYYDENPPTKRHWSYWLFIKHLNPEDNAAIDGSDYAAMVLNPEDNKENIDEDYITGILDKLPEKERNRFKLGLFNDDADGSAYYEFKRDQHVKDCTYNAGTILAGMDFNVQPMTAVIAQVFDNTIYVFDEAFLENSDTMKMSHELRSRGYGGAHVFPDSTGKNRKTSGKSDFAILKEDGFVIESTRNPLVFDRINCVNRLFKEGRIIISPKCKKLINDLEKVAWKDNELDERNDPMLTHISDALGYLCYKLYPIKPPPKRTESYGF